jgi:tetratricopeptide (TPR) repeat protein
MVTLSAAALTRTERADSAYNAKDFSTALKFYNEALENDGVSSNSYYNIGNTYYRLDDMGRAIISYERALKLDPSNEDARVNLEFLNSKILDKPEDDSTFLMNVHNSIVSQASPNGWAWIAFTVFMITIGFVVMYLYASSITIRKVGFFGGIILVFVFIYALCIAYRTADAIERHDSAVVVVPTTNLNSAPSSPKSKTDRVVPIHEGTKLEIIDSVATPQDPAASMWYNVKINNTTQAWVSGSDIEKI